MYLLETFFPWKFIFKRGARLKLEGVLNSKLYDVLRSDDLDCNSDALWVIC